MDDISGSNGCHIAHRSVDDVSIIAEKAKLELADLLPTCQTLFFSNNFQPDQHQIKLVEVDEHVIQAVQGGERLVLRGDADDSAVLCTSQRTYEVREAETSNSLLLLQSVTWPQHMCPESATQRSVMPRKVTGVFYKYLELRECRPRLRRLLQLLGTDPYAGRHRTGTGHDLEQLNQLVQCSDQQLQEGLRQCGAVRLTDGLYYGLEFEYEFHVLDLLIRFADENSWCLDAVRGEQAVSTLSDLEPEPVLRVCLNRFFDSTGTEGEGLYACREADVCQMYARLLLRPVNSFNLQEFLSVWTQSVPRGLNPDVRHLDGVAVVDRQRTPAVVSHLLPQDLPEQLNDRFRTLFDLKQRWTLEELAPYLHDVISQTLTLTSLLAKHTRAATVEGVKTYGPKHIIH